MAIIIIRILIAVQIIRVINNNNKYKYSNILNKNLNIIIARILEMYINIQ